MGSAPAQGGHEGQEDVYVAELREVAENTASWRAGHYRCTADVYEDCAFDVSRCRTDRHMLAWTVHLLGKLWVSEETDWTRFVYAHVPS